MFFFEEMLWFFKYSTTQSQKCEVSPLTENVAIRKYMKIYEMTIDNVLSTILNMRNSFQYEKRTQFLRYTSPQIHGVVIITKIHAVKLSVRQDIHLEQAKCEAIKM